MSLDEPQPEAPTRSSPALLQGVRIAQLRLSIEAVLHLLLTRRQFRVHDSPIPEGAVLKSVCVDRGDAKLLICVLEHPSFALWKPGAAIPDLGDVTIQTMHDAPDT